VQQQDVDVGLGSELAPAVATHGDERDAVGRGAPGRPPEQRAEPVVDELRVGLAPGPADQAGVVEQGLPVVLHAPPVS
jgi:hypothetical protein